MCSWEKRGRIYILNLTGDGEHRLGPELLHAIRSALTQVRAHSAGCRRGAALVTTAEGKYFSNGLDISLVGGATSADRAANFAYYMETVIRDLMSLPMPTIAAVTGHACGAGGVLAMAHDYVLMRGDRGYFYMSEVEVGAPVTRHFMALVRSKIPDAKIRRDVMLRSLKMTAAEAAERSVIDRAVAGGAGETVAAAVKLGEELAGRDWDGDVYASVRRGAFPELWEEWRTPATQRELDALAAEIERYHEITARL